MAMVIRLNQMAAGYTAMSEDAARAYAEYVNNDVTPLIPSKGSEGANDLSFATRSWASGMSCGRASAARRRTSGRNSV